MLAGNALALAGGTGTLAAFAMVPATGGASLLASPFALCAALAGKLSAGAAQTYDSLNPKKVRYEAATVARTKYSNAWEMLFQALASLSRVAPAAWRMIAVRLSQVRALLDSY